MKYLGSKTAIKISWSIPKDQKLILESIFKYFKCLFQNLIVLGFSILVKNK